MFRSTCAVLIAAVGLFPLTACSSPPATGHVSASFLKRANEACQEALNQVGSTPFPYDTFNEDDPDVSQLPYVGQYFDGIVFEHKEVAVINAAGHPSQGRKTWAVFGDLVAQEQKADEAQIAAAKAADKAAFVSSVKQISQLATKIDAAAKQVGFAKSDACVLMTGSPTT